MTASLALAAGTPAGTRIQNQASATYEDASGKTLSSTSNQVLTIVNPVASLSITPNGDETQPGQQQNATPGQTVYFPYILTNTGNATDSFTLDAPQIAGSITAVPGSIKYYLDANNNGLLDPGENTPITRINSLAADASASFIVAYTVPTNAAAGGTILVSPVGSSVFDPTKKDGDGQGTNTFNYNKTTVVQNGVISASKSVDKSFIAPVANPSGTENELNYVITARNTGSALVTDVVISDVLPQGVDYVSASTPNGATPVYDAATRTVRVANAAIEAGGNVQLFIKVNVKANAQPGPISNSATVNYKAGGVDQPQIVTNAAITTVQATRAIALGPNAYPAGDAPSDSYVQGGYSILRNADTQMVLVGNAGTLVAFANTLKNNGTASDTFNLSAPALRVKVRNANGTTEEVDVPVSFTRLDGTPLYDTNGDNIPDSGPVPADGTFSFLTRVALPANLEEDNDGNTTVHSVVVTAISVASSSQDTTTNTIADFRAGTVLFGNATPDLGVSTDVVNRSSAPATSVSFPMDVVNYGGSQDNFNLNGSVTFTRVDGGNVAVPVRYYLPNAQGTAPDLTKPVTNTGAIAPGTETQVFAVVDVPADAVAGTYTVNQRVTSPLTGASAAYNANTVTVTANHTITLTPNRDGSLTSPGTVIYQHTLTNTGTAPLTAVTLGQSVSGPDGFTYTYSLDGSTYGPAGLFTFDTDPATPGNQPLAPGQSQVVYVKVDAAGGLSAGATSVLTLSVTGNFGGTAGNTATVTDTSVIIAGTLSLSKSVDKPNAVPGDNLVYTVVAKNTGSANLLNVRVADALPTFTDFVSVSGATSIALSGSKVMYSVTGASGSWSTSAPSSLNVGQSVYIAVDTNNDNEINALDVLPAQATLTLTFTVKVQQ
nr:hypothetical protein [Deinobacterium chartae]